jgi:hypothetical protein
MWALLLAKERSSRKEQSSIGQPLKLGFPIEKRIGDLALAPQ